MPHEVRRVGVLEDPGVRGVYRLPHLPASVLRLWASEGLPRGRRRREAREGKREMSKHSACLMTWVKKHREHDCTLGLTHRGDHVCYCGARRKRAKGKGK